MSYVRKNIIHENLIIPKNLVRNNGKEKLYYKKKHI